MPSAVRYAHCSTRGKPSCPGRWTRRGLRLRTRSCFARLNRVSRACGLGAGALPPGRLPTRGRVSGGWGRQRQPAPPKPSIDPAGAGCDCRGGGQRCPGPTFTLRLTWLLLRRSVLTQRLRAHGLRCMARTVARPCAVSRLLAATAGLGAQGRIPPPESATQPRRP